ncbi:MAG: hypothetical protein ACLU37_07330 [Collinsella sp.]
MTDWHTRHAKAEPLQQQVVWQRRIHLDRADSSVTLNSTQRLPHRVLVTATQPVTKRIDVPHILGGALKPFNNNETQRLAKLVIGKPRSTGASAVSRLLGHVRREEAGQV